MEELAEMYPTRCPVWWARRGLVEIKTNETGVTGRLVVIRIWKENNQRKGLGKFFNYLEKILFKMTKGPRDLRRPLDDMNSLLWELCDGSRNFSQICKIMDEVFTEHISPVEERTAIALRQFESLGFLIILKQKFDKSWPNGPGVQDPNNPLPEPNSELGLDVNPLEGEISN
ncbi:MAG: Uncharacterised protein [Methanobacteriota archaeon]|nr:MAG: Uncharacterised protein [Euryarchaeota archaeon]